ncbi:glycerate kinase, partial [Streptococcus pneumoniae]|uniref:glycerate kinase n=1 Tax=Streptococcus pneumoniae TaxID=1313 RepID=UPI000B1675BD
MKIVIAPDSFKESLTAQQVAEAIKRGFQQSIADVECLLCPVGDGGEGTVDAIRHSLDLKEKWIQVTDPFGQKEAMRYFQKGELALFEVADKAIPHSADFNINRLLTPSPIATVLSLESF